MYKKEKETRANRTLLRLKHHPTARVRKKKTNKRQLVVEIKNKPPNPSEKGTRKAVKQKRVEKKPL